MHGWGNYMCRYCPKIKLLEDTTSLQSIENNEKKKIRFQKYGQYQYTYIYILYIVFIFDYFNLIMISVFAPCKFDVLMFLNLTARARLIF